MGYPIGFQNLSFADMDAFFMFPCLFGHIIDFLLGDVFAN